MVKTLYIADRLALGDSWLAGGRGLIFVGRPDGSAWHAVIFDSAAGALDGYENDAPLPFTATTRDGLWLEGIVQLGIGDDETSVRFLRGLGLLSVSRLEGERALPSAASWSEARRLRRAC